MKVLFLSSEVVPFAKTGGLADVAGSLPKALSKLGNDVRIFMPRYKKVGVAKFGLKSACSNLIENVSILEARIPDSEVTTYFVDHAGYFGGREELYTVNGKDYADNLERFSLFCRAVIAFLKKSAWVPDVIHCNDWQTALVIAYLKVLYKADPLFQKTATVYSVHNMGYLGLFGKEKLPLTGLGWDQFVPEKLEFWGQIALTKAGFVYADVISTVSETYAKEIQTPEFGCGLDGLLVYRTRDVYGIMNGLDYSLWNPETDPLIVKKYGSETLSLKKENKIALQKGQGLPRKNIPLIGMTTRLTDQKGFDILAGAMEAIMQLNCQIVILGTGEPKYHTLLEQMKKKYSEHIGVNLGFNSALAQMIYAASDMFLIPSKYEPCGLGQLISFKYGTLPIVRKTGGLADTVHDFNPQTGEGDGFVFEDYSAQALLQAVRKAIETYQNKKVWVKLQKRIMTYDYSWDASAKKYLGLYQKALVKARR